jgi:hypothetical protein
MYIFETGRQKGKTETLIDWVKAKPNRVIVTISYKECDRLIKKYGLSSNQVCTYNSTLPRARGLEVAIDNLDLVLEQVYGDVKIVTLTKED